MNLSFINPNLEIKSFVSPIRIHCYTFLIKPDLKLVKYFVLFYDLLTLFQIMPDKINIVKALNVLNAVAINR